MEKVCLNGNCIFCKAPQKIVVNRQDYVRYMKGESYVQDLFPYLSVEEREFLISRTCGKCFEGIFAKDESCL